MSKTYFTKPLVLKNVKQKCQTYNLKWENFIYVVTLCTHLQLNMTIPLAIIYNIWTILFTNVAK